MSKESATVKLNQDATERYAKNFASKVCDSFFRTNKKITGGEILKLTAVEQVNVFVLKIVFDFWQKETAKLKSPYFDYERPEVKEALSVFMDKLSRFILLDRATLEPLLQTAVADTLFLSINPVDFYCKEVNQLSANIPTFEVAALEKLVRFYKLNGEIFKKTASVIQSQLSPTLYKGEFKREIWNVISNGFTLDPCEPVFEGLSKVIPIKPADIIDGQLPKYLQKEIAKTTETSASEFKPSSIVLNDDEVEIVPIPRKTVVPAEDAEPKEIVTPRFNFDITEDSLTSAKEPVAHVTVSEMGVGRRRAANLNETMQSATSNSLLEKMGGASLGQSLADRTAYGKIESLAKSIKMQDRARYISALFEGDVDNWEKAVKEIDNAANKNEAIELLMNKFLPRYGWNFYEPNAESFLKLVERRFS